MIFFMHSLFLVSVLVTGAYAATPGEIGIGRYLREAALNGLNTENRNLADYQGKPLIINVWASWCGPCRAEMDSLQQLAERHNGNQLNLIGISTDDYRNRAEAFIKQTNITFENFIDHNLILENMLGANTIPLTILVDKDGRILEKVRGAYDWNSPGMMRSLGKVFHIELD